MKTIIFRIPTTFKEFRIFAKELFKCMAHPVRSKHNREVMWHLYAEIVKELHSNYWNNDISQEMRTRLCNGAHNGIIWKFISEAIGKLK